MKPIRLALLTVCVVLPLTLRAQDEPLPPPKEDPQRSDNHGDPLTAEALVRLGTTRLRHGNHVSSVAFTPDGKVLVSAGGDRSIRMWDTANGKELRRIGFEEGDLNNFFLTAVVSPDGKTLAMPENDKVRLWDLATAKEQTVLTVEGNNFSFVAFSPDSKTLVVDGNEGLIMWDLATRKQVRHFKTYTRNMTGRTIAFSADGTLLAGGDGACVRIWEASTGKLLHKLRRHVDTVTSVAFSPDGKILASAGADNAIRLWDPATGNSLVQIAHPNTRASTQHFVMENQAAIGLVVFAPGGKSLFSLVRDDRWIREWDVATGKELRRFLGHQVGSLCLSVSADGKMLAVGAGDSSIRVWDLETGNERFAENGHRGRVYNLAFGGDGKTVISAGRDNTVRVWDRVTGKELRRFASDADSIGFVTFGPGSKVMASGRQDDEAIQLWDVATGKLLRELIAEETGLASVTISADGKLTAAIDQNDNVSLWETETGKHLRRWKGQAGGDNVIVLGSGIAKPLAFSPDGKLLATLGLKANNAEVLVYLWETDTGKLQRQFSVDNQDRDFFKVAFTSDGRTLVTVSQGNVSLWAVATGKTIAKLENVGVSHPQGMVNMESVAFSPDSKFLAVVGPDSKLLVVETTTGQEIRQFETRQGWIGSVAFAPDSRTVSTGGMDTTVLLWDIAGQSQPAKELTARDLDETWNALLGDAAVAYRSAWSLLGAPRQAVPYLRERVKPLVPVEPQRLAKLMADLDSNDFNVRQRATDDLEKLGELSEDALTKVLAGKPTLEARQRIEGILQKSAMVALSGEKLRSVRALGLLEHMGTPEARQVLEQVARGVPQARLTQEAKAAVERLGKKAAP